LINGSPTYEGVTFEGRRVEGLLMNSRMVQVTFDDRNPDTRARWSYPDGPWDPDRNTSEFIAHLPEYRAHGLLAFTINLQGGSPEGYSNDQPWINSGFEADGSLRPDYAGRVKRVLDAADELGMIVIVGFFYFGQDQYLEDEQAVRRAVEQATEFLVRGGWRNVIVEIANEVDIPRYDHAIVRPDRCHELINLAGNVCERRLPAGTSFGGGSIPTPNVVAASDVLLIHGNGVNEPARIREMVRTTRAISEYRGQPVVFNEDDHFDFELPDNNMLAALDEHASWGFFDYRMKGESYSDGYQSVPVDWGIHSARKHGFFSLLRQVTGQ
jgi:hypothetical protein